ncbi:hypothetical protein MKZ38_006929 [Zalerion maritima]|uniref:Rhodopsin domain-containing protein n=1 Tax=Zalerion maritima TaxID=339359 RepID=A0AAD5S375_9PEZI|nr:hypothetical protein MKZ38_006929 [Zalerion maritima]
MITVHEVPILATLVVMHTLCTAVMIARVYVRVRIVRIFWLEDYLMLGCYAFSLSMMATHLFQIVDLDAIGIPKPLIVPSAYRSYRITLWLLSWLYGVTLTLCKLSILSQFHRIFSSSHRTIPLLCKIMMVLVVLLGLYISLGSVLRCVPPKKLWEDAADGKCMDRTGFFFSHSVLNIVTDVAIFALPLGPIRKMKLPRVQRWALMGVFGLGFFVCITSTIRLVGLYQITQSINRAKNGINIAVWSTVEINAAIICGSLPMLKPLDGDGDGDLDGEL